MLTRRQFLGYYVNMEMFTRTEAERMWSEALEDSQVFKETNETNEMTVAVRMPQTWHGYRSLGKKRELRELADVDPASVLREPKRLRTNEESAQAWLAGEVGAQCLLPGHHVVPRLVQEHDTTNGSDGDDGSAHVVDLVRLRNHCSGEARKAINNFCDKKTSNYQSLKALIDTKLGQDHKEVQTLSVKERLAEFEKHMEIVRDVLGRVAGWTQHSVMVEAERVLVAMAAFGGHRRPHGKRLGSVSGRRTSPWRATTSGSSA